MNSMNTRQKMPSLPRWLVNIGLTLQFYFPGSLYLFIICGYIYGIVTSPPGARVPGLAVVIGMLILIILLVVTTWLIIYLHWDRYGNRRNALVFLIVMNIVGGGIWLLWWIAAFSPGIWYDLDVWLFSPAPIAVPTLLYIIALVLLRMREKTETRNISNMDGEPT